MKSTNFIKVSVILLVIIAYASCNHAKELTVNNSSHNITKSHNIGQNCISCHKKGGEGKGWFTVAGTAYQQNNSTAQNVKVKLYSQANGEGTLVKEIPGDLLGNFYTTDILSFGTGLYPVIEYNGAKHYMSSSITMGACNSCHGISTSKIMVD